MSDLIQQYPKQLDQITSNEMPHYSLICIGNVLFLSTIKLNKNLKQFREAKRYM